MAALTGTEAGGLGSRAARWAFVFLWAYISMLAVLDGSLHNTPLLTSATLCIAVRRPAADHPGDLPAQSRRGAGVVEVGLALTAAGLSLATEITHLWAMEYAAYLVSFLIVRGNLATGALGSTLVVALAVTLAWPRQPSVEQWMLLLGIPLGSVLAAVVWHLVLRWLVARERHHRTSAARDAERAEADAEALATTRDELARIRAEVTPLLRRVAAGEELSGSLHAELAFVEASLRDRIRAPQLNHPELVSTIGTLRRHGSRWSCWVSRPCPASRSVTVWRRRWPRRSPRSAPAG